MGTFLFIFFTYVTKIYDIYHVTMYQYNREQDRVFALMDLLSLVLVVW